MVVSRLVCYAASFDGISIVSRCFCEYRESPLCQMQRESPSSFPPSHTLRRLYGPKMSLEATMIVLDNSANSLNGDFPRAFPRRDPPSPVR